MSRSSRRESELCRREVKFENWVVLKKNDLWRRKMYMAEFVHCWTRPRTRLRHRKSIADCMGDIKYTTMKEQRRIQRWLDVRGVVACGDVEGLLCRYRQVCGLAGVVEAA